MRKTNMPYPGTGLLIVLSLFLFPLVSLAQEAPGPEGKALLDSAVVLDEQGKAEDALDLLRDGLKRFTKPDEDRYFTLNYMYTLLKRLRRYEEAIGVAVEKANIITSPKQALNVAEAYLQTGDRSAALDWLEKSVERGLQSYDVLEREAFQPIREEPRARKAIEIVKKRNGINLPAKDFTRKAISGSDVSLEAYAGKVLLVDFWATWCLPCLEEMPHLVEYYERYNRKGFEIVGFAADQDLRQLTSYMKKAGITWEMVQAADLQKDETIMAYKVENIPASFLIDRNGILREVNLTGAALENAIARLVSE